VPEQVNKSLFHWICYQKTYLHLYQEKKTGSGKFPIGDCYVKYLTKLGLGKKEKI
jgi:hypothetical protein